MLQVNVVIGNQYLLEGTTRERGVAPEIIQIEVTEFLLIYWMMSLDKGRCLVEISARYDLLASQSR